MSGYYEIEHSSGLKIILNLMSEHSFAYSVLGVRYGSCNNEFKKDGDISFLSFPQGIAHFLEHKMFENEDGEDTFQKFAKTGALANAYTGFDRTCYLFSCSKNVEESLKILLDYITHPYFTDENVEKEKDIIAQEIKMCQDSPRWQGYFGVLNGLYSQVPIFNDIAGTEESIRKITKEDLYKCYEMFYKPSNMVLSIAGHFTKKEILKIVDDIFTKKETSKIINKIYDEPKEAISKKKTKKMSVKIPLLHIGYKHLATNSLKDNYINSVKHQLANELIVGSTSELFGYLYYKGVISNPIDYEVVFGPSYLMSIFCIETKHEEEVVKCLGEAIDKIKKQGISESDFVAIKKSFYGRYIMEQDDPETIAENYMEASLYNYNFDDLQDLVLNIDKTEIESLIRETYDEQSSCVSVIKPSIETY